MKLAAFCGFFALLIQALFSIGYAMVGVVGMDEAAYFFDCSSLQFTIFFSGSTSFLSVVTWLLVMIFFLVLFIRQINAKVKPIACYGLVGSLLALVYSLTSMIINLVGYNEAADFFDCTIKEFHDGFKFVGSGIAFIGVVLVMVFFRILYLRHIAKDRERRILLCAYLGAFFSVLCSLMNIVVSTIELKDLKDLAEFFDCSTVEFCDIFSSVSFFVTVVLCVLEMTFYLAVFVSLNSKLTPNALIKIDVNSVLGISCVDESGSIQTANSHWYSFDGRARRSEYWTISLITNAVMVVVAVFFFIAPIYICAEEQLFSVKSLFANVSRSLFMLGVCVTFSMILFVLGILFLIPVTIRRLHDLNMSGWWVLVFVVLQCIPYLCCVSVFAQFVILGCNGGISGENKYGPDPKVEKLI